MNQDEILKVLNEAKEGNHYIELTYKQPLGVSFVATVDKVISGLAHFKRIDFSNSNFKSVVDFNIVESVRTSSCDNFNLNEIS